MNINPFIDLITMVLNLYATIMLVHIVFIWLIYFEILNRYNQVIHRVSDILYRLTEPVLTYIRRFIPSFGGIDLSPIVVFILIRFFISVLHTYFYK